ncbi:MAG: threo-3-hydroxy-L-aspartate ammonia-lyase [Deltaproteobacteria bacterium]|nr:threo-3-hydroxy-L-aspartate ammonia-lyase [Deltaproteobacteria bacterium]MBT4069004.1 threo-3-hydroxy-L-aspartate ammonia-lyase [Candidatus Neomarinimicrobiota bacterium]MBT5176960.1 threo-3-hydroxy-L-aspartate ammonia-lyase [Candidatus Neomarinimicrobiota bacterium]MBT6637117.1 threo-3-hydroxy-L-aspartate ammonia-lyase [Candidatus Neomarinimicrobiota bacterium]
MFAQVKAAQERLKGVSHVTPIMTSHTLNRKIGAEVYFKCENFQKIGAFKIRGAFNSISQLTEAEQKRGVLAHSSGNHAQGVALAGQILNVQTTIVMPINAPVIKRAATEDYGATVVEYDPEQTTPEAAAQNIAAQQGYTVIPPFDNLDVIAGQGTVALEMFEELGQLDMLLVPCGGGGLLSGSAISAKALSPHCEVVGIEPELADDATRSFHTKTLHRVKNPPTIADGTRTASLGEITFPLVLEHVDDMKTVSEAAIMEAVQFLFFRMKLVVEPSGALGLAALLSQAVIPKGRIGIIISGGNIDATTMNTILNT